MERRTQVETRLHESLKEAAFHELAKEGYDLYVEPLEPPLERLTWSFYRPDILGVICDEKELRLVVVECETNPQIRRIKRKISKIKHSFSFQKRLNEEHLFRLLLVIPYGMLHKVHNPGIHKDIPVKWD